MRVKILTALLVLATLVALVSYPDHHNTILLISAMVAAALLAYGTIGLYASMSKDGPVFRSLSGWKQLFTTKE